MASLAECRVLTEDKYFTDPIAGEVYRVDGPGKPLVKLADSPTMSKKTQKTGEQHLKGYRVYLKGYRVSLRTNSGDSGGKKTYPLARVIYSSVFPFFAPLSTMDHIDGHQFNGIHNIVNCPKKENPGNRGKKYYSSYIDCNISSSLINQSDPSNEIVHTVFAITTTNKQQVQ
ncbi:MAG: hypothetical protein ACI8RD_013791 [Bacillariaceae sp.]